MKKLRLLVPVSVIAAVVLLLMAPVGALAAPGHPGGGHQGENQGNCEESYKVQCHDTLAKIARKYGTSVWELAEINDIENVNLIYRGQTLCVDSANGGKKGDANGGWKGDPNGGKKGDANGGWKGDENGGKKGDHNGGFWYTVRCGDTLGDLGWRFGSSAMELAEVNDIENPNHIYRGQTLWIPEDD